MSASSTHIPPVLPPASMARPGLTPSTTARGLPPATGSLGPRPVTVVTADAHNARRGMPLAVAAQTLPVTTSSTSRPPVLPPASGLPFSGLPTGAVPAPVSVHHNTSRRSISPGPAFYPSSTVTGGPSQAMSMPFPRPPVHASTPLPPTVPGHIPSAPSGAAHTTYTGIPASPAVRMDSIPYPTSRLPVGTLGNRRVTQLPVSYPRPASAGSGPAPAPGPRSWTTTAWSIFIVGLSILAVTSLFFLFLI